MQINLLKMCCFILVLDQICEIRKILLFCCFITKLPPTRSRITYHVSRITYHTKQYMFQVSFILNSLVHILKVTSNL